MIRVEEHRTKTREKHKTRIKIRLSVVYVMMIHRQISCARNAFPYKFSHKSRLEKKSRRYTRSITNHNQNQWYNVVQ